MKVCFRGKEHSSKISENKLNYISLGFGIEEIETSESFNNLVSKGFFRKLKMSMGVLESYVKSNTGISYIKTELPCVLVKTNKDKDLPAILRRDLNLRKKLRENTHHLFNYGSVTVPIEPIKPKEIYLPPKPEMNNSNKLLSFLSSVIKPGGVSYEDKMFTYLDKHWFNGEFKSDLRNWAKFLVSFDYSHPLDIDTQSVIFYKSILIAKNKKDLLSTEFLEKLKPFLETREKEKERRDFFKFLALESYSQDQLFSVLAKVLYATDNSCNEWKNSLLELHYQERKNEDKDSRALARLMATMSVLDIGQGVCSKETVNFHLTTGTVGDYLNVQKQIDDLYHQRTGKSVEKSRFSWKRNWDHFDNKQAENVGKLMAALALYTEPEDKEDVYKLFHSLVNSSIMVKNDVYVKNFDLITINLDDLKIPLFQREITRDDDPRIFLNTLINMTQETINKVTENNKLLDESLYQSAYSNIDSLDSGIFTLDKQCDFYLGKREINVDYLIKAIHIVLPDISQELYPEFRNRNVSGNILNYKEYVPQLTEKYKDCLLATMNKFELDDNFEKIAKEKGFEYVDEDEDEDEPSGDGCKWKI